MSEKDSSTDHINMSEKDSSTEKTASLERGGGGLMSKLPTEIFMDILRRVSMKTLSPCRFVCKAWFFTIQNPSFITTYNNNLVHTNNDINSSVIIQRYKTVQLLDLDSETFTLKLPLKLHLRDNGVIGGYDTIFSSNGLLLVAKNYDYCVCNPITGHHVALPRYPLYDEENDGLATGFGYDPVSKVCKFVRISRIGIPRRMTKVEVYDLVMGEWRVMDGKKLLIRPIYHSTTTDLANARVDGKEKKVTLESIRMLYPDTQLHTFVNGALHWMGYWKASKRMIIISFKLDTEEFYHVPCPSSFTSALLDYDDSEGQLYLLVVRECLSLVHCIGDEDDVLCLGNEHVEIWGMRDYGLESSWEKTYIIRNIIMDDGNLIRGPYMPVEFRQNGEFLLVCSRGQKIGCYQPETKKFKLLIYSEHAYYPTPLPHMCSLTSPGNISK